MSRKTVNKSVSQSLLSRSDKHKIQDLIIKPRCDDRPGSAHGNAGSKASCWRYIGHMFENSTSDKPIDSSRYHCILCLEEQKTGGCHLSKVASFSKSTSSSNMNKHLLDKHEIIVDSTQAKIPLILSYIDKHRQTSASVTGSDNEVTKISSHEFNRDLVMWFVRDLLAFENVAKDGMKDFMKKNLPVVTLPTPETLAGTALNDLYVAVLAKIKEELSTVRSICVMADGWTDRYHGRSFVGIRVSCVKNWQYCLFTLSCRAMPGSHTGQHLADHIRQILSKFFPDLKKMLIVACHDGAANMMKSSQLLKVQSVQHCVAHSLHLLITVDSIWRIGELKELIQRCREIVTTLHFKSDLLEDDATSVADLDQLTILQARIQQVNDVVEVDEQFPISDSDEESMPLGSSLADDLSSQSKMQHRHRSLKGSCPTRWNSTLVMIESILDLSRAVDNTLKKIGLAELCLSSEDIQLLKSLTVFLKGFEKFTELVSATVPTLSIVPLMKLQIKKMCTVDPVMDEDAIKSLKELVLINVDRRLKENEFMKINQVLDPMTKSVLSEAEATELVKAAFLIAKQKGLLSLTTGPTTISQPTQQNESDHVPVPSSSTDGNDGLAVQYSEVFQVKKPKLALLRQELIAQLNDTGRLAKKTDDEMLKLEIEGYLSLQLCEPNMIAKYSDNPLMFWADNAANYPLLQQLASLFLGMSAGSVPVECLFSITGLISNSRRSSICPSKLNKISFLHDNLDFIMSQSDQ